MIKDKQRFVGSLKVELFDEHGNLKDQRDVKNLVVNTGKTWISARMVGTSVGVMSHMAIGSGTVAAAVGDTALGSELGRAALTALSSSGAVVTHTATFAAGVGTGAITEAGIFNASSSGTMLSRAVFDPITKDANETLAITWTVTAS